MKFICKTSVILLLLMAVFARITAQQAGSTGRWERTGGPCSASVSAVSIAGMEIIVGTPGGGVFRSSNGGTLFENVTNNLPGTTITATMIKNTEILVGASGSGIYKSSDQGASWIESNNGITNLNITSMQMLGSYIFASSSGGGVYRTANNGANWSSTNNGLSSLNINLLYASGAKLYAGSSDKGLYMSVDYGDSWTAISNSLSSKNIKSVLEINNRLIVGLNTGIAYSDNAGTAWTTNSTNISNTVNSLATNGSRIWGATEGGGCPYSTDYGTTWQTQSTSGFFPMIGKLVLYNGSTLYYGSGGAGLYYSNDDGSNWWGLNNGLQYSSPNGLYFEDGVMYAGVWGGGVQKSTDGSATWTQINNGLNTTSVKTFAKAGNKIFAGATFSGGLWYTSDLGANWSVQVPSKSIYDISPVPNNTGGYQAYAAASDGVYRFDGTTWTKNSSLQSSTAQCVQFDGLNGIAGYYSQAPYFTSDGGLTWNRATGTLPGANNIQCALFNGTQTVVGTYNNGIYATSDMGATWTSLNNGIPTYYSINSLIKAGSIWIAATQYNGIIATDNLNGTWKDIDDGLPNSTVYDMVTDGSYVFVGTFAYGVYKRSIQNIIDDYFTTQYAVTITCNPYDGGTATGAGYYIPGTSASVSATPNTGFNFTGWAENGITINTNTSFAFTVNTNVMLTANFTKQRFTITLQKNSEFAGEVLGAGTYDYGTVISVTANRLLGYHFTAWKENDLVVSTNSNYSFEVKSNRTLVAFFELDAPLNVTNPYPPNGGTQIPINSKLSWSNPQNQGRITKTNIYLYKQPAQFDWNGFPIYTTTEPVNEYSPPLYFDGEAFYSWGVEQWNDLVKTQNGPYGFGTSSTTGIEKIRSGIPKEYKLFQNYPNPFNPSTQIEFDLPSESRVKMEIYNAIGQRIELIAEETKSAGSYSIYWNGSKYNSGIYFCRFEAIPTSGNSRFADIKKIVLMK